VSLRVVVSIALSAVFLATVAPAGVPAGPTPLAGEIQAVKVVRQDGREVFLPADEARPKDVVEYRLTYANTGATALRSVTVTDPVPAGTEYIINTATRPEAGTVEFSIDAGRNYQTWPIRIKKTNTQGQEVEVEATPDQVTHIRWTIAGDLEPQSSMTFIYRATVK